MELTNFSSLLIALRANKSKIHSTKELTRIMKITVTAARGYIGTHYVKSVTVKMVQRS